MKKASSLFDMEIDRSLPIAAYYQLAEMIRREVSSGNLKPGDQLPPIRVIAESCNISPFTVKRAYESLVREGMLISRAGAGTFVATATPPAIEVIVPYDEKRDFFPDRRFLQMILERVEKEFEGESRRCFMSHITTDHSSAAEIIGVCRARKVNGLIVYRPHGVFLSELKKVSEVVPTVSLVYPIDGAPGDCVAIDPRPAMMSMLEERIAQGRRNFAFLGTSRHADGESGRYDPYQIILDTYREALASHGIDHQEHLADIDYANHEETRSALAESLSDDCVVLTSFPSIIDQLPLAEKSNLDILSYTEYHETLINYSEIVSMLYAGIEACTRTAIGLLRERLEKPRMPARTARIEPEIFEARCGKVEKGGGYEM